MALEAIQYDPPSLRILNQLSLPHKVEYDVIENTEDAWRAIREMRVRGAPAIAMVGILGLSVELEGMRSGEPPAKEQLVRLINEKLDYLVTSRPTAVNLRNMVEEFRQLVFHVARTSGDRVDGIFDLFAQAAGQTLKDDIRDNVTLGDHGAEWIVRKGEAAGDRRAVSVLTHCNTGSLATAGYGTALGVIRSLHQRKALKRAFCTETRPYNQGSRLTAFELLHDQIPATLITDSMAATLLRLRGSEENIVAVVVGADRVAANGDTANKIGTYALAVAARAHGVSFVVAAPCSTIDPSTASGEHIHIETRPPTEMTTLSGPVVSADGTLSLDRPPERISVAAAGIDVWNPAFDVTPAGLIDCIVTEKGVAERDGSGSFDLKAFF